MTAPSARELPNTAGPKGDWLHQASDRVARMVATSKNRSVDTLRPGDIAELRRLNPGDPVAPSFWKLLNSLEDLVRLPASGNQLAEQERRWACFFNAAAILSDLHRRDVPLGLALAKAELSEIRFVRLLRAEEHHLFVEVRHTARFLAAKGQVVDIYGFALLLMSDGTDFQESVRRNTARSYYSNITQ